MALLSVGGFLVVCAVLAYLMTPPRCQIGRVRIISAARKFLDRDPLQS